MGTAPNHRRSHQSRGWKAKPGEERRLTNAVGRQQEAGRARQHLEVLLLGSVDHQADLGDLRRRSSRSDAWTVLLPPGCQR